MRQESKEKLRVRTRMRLMIDLYSIDKGVKSWFLKGCGDYSFEDICNTNHLGTQEFTL